MKALLVAIGASVLVAATAFAQSATMTPEQGIAAAAANPDRGVEGAFEFVVQSVGETKAKQGTIIYLNSDTSYRSSENISAMIMPLTAKSLAEKLGGSVKEKIVGKRVVVTGTAKQTRIDFRDEDTNKPVGQYYFQTRISVKGPDQVKIL